MFKSLTFLALILGALWGPQSVYSVQLSNCNTNPSDMDDENVVDDGDTLTISCNSDSKVLSCIWRHIDPISYKDDGPSSNNAIFCTGSIDNSGNTCQQDTRITFRNTEQSCSVDISNTKPEDTGDWYLTVMSIQNTGSGKPQQADKNFEIYTYNQSQLFMVDADDQPENSISTSYNYNTRQEEWIDGKSGWERVEFGCKAFGGRPIPTFRWYINNNQNDDLTDDNHFQITTSSIGSQYDFIENYQSTIDFQVDDNFLETLNNYGIDTNPENNRFEIEITCEVTQGNNNGYLQTQQMRISVDRQHDNGALKGSLIGVIVGVVCAALLLLVAIGLLIFAKANNQWCFADDQDPRGDYRNPSNPRSHPNAAGGGGRPPNQQAQVYRDNIDKEDEKKIRTRQSSTSSNNTSPKKASAPINSQQTQKNNGEWLPDSRKSAYTTTPSATPTLAANTNLNNQPPPRTTSPAASSSSSSSSSASPAPANGGHNNNNADPPPPRPPKDGLQYANLDHRAFMQDPKNRVFPPGSSGSLPPTSTTYATVKTREVVQTSSRTFGGTQLPRA